MDAKELCLGALARGPASGYEIRKQFEEGPFRHFYQVGFGSIYPALERLLQAGLVTCMPSVEGKGPLKKVYSLTAAGAAAFRAALQAAPAPVSVRSDFLFTLFFARWLPPERVRALIDAQIAWYARELAAMSTPCPAAGPGEAFVKGFGEAVYHACKDYLEANREALPAALAAAPEAAE